MITLRKLKWADLDFVHSLVSRLDGERYMCCRCAHDSKPKSFSEVIEDSPLDLRMSFVRAGLGFTANGEAASSMRFSLENGICLHTVR